MQMTPGTEGKVGRQFMKVQVRCFTSFNFWSQIMTGGENDFVIMYKMW